MSLINHLGFNGSIISFLERKQVLIERSVKRCEGIAAHCGENVLLGMVGNAKKRARAEKDDGF